MFHLGTATTMDEFLCAFRWVELLTVLASAKLHAVVLAELVCPGIDVKPRAAAAGCCDYTLSE